MTACDIVLLHYSKGYWWIPAKIDPKSQRAFDRPYFANMLNDLMTQKGHPAIDVTIRQVEAYLKEIV